MNQELFEKHVCYQATVRNTDDFCYTKEVITYNHQINAFTVLVLVLALVNTGKGCLAHWVSIQLVLSEKMNGIQRRTLVSPRRMHCTYCGMPKGTSWAEVTSHSEKNQACSLNRY